jgi:hypothetical protein
MNTAIANWLSRIQTRINLIRDDMRKTDCPQAMLDCAEMQTQAEFLYAEIQKFYKKQLAARDNVTAATGQNKGHRN